MFERQVSSATSQEVYQLNILAKPGRSRITCKFDLPKNFDKDDIWTKVLIMMTYHDEELMPDQIESVSVNSQGVG